MAIKILLLKSGENLIADVKDRLVDGKFCAYRLKDPRIIIETNSEVEFLTEEPEEQTEKSTIDISLAPWCLLSDDQEIDVNPDWVVYMVNPISDILDLYVNPQNERDQVYFTGS